MARPGQTLLAEEVREFNAYHNAGVSLPDKFSGVIVDATDPRGIVYRYATADESKAAADAAKAQADAVAAHDALMAKVRTEASKRQDVAPPPMPPA